PQPRMGLLPGQGAKPGLEAKFMGPEGVGNPDINAIAGASVEGMLVTLPADFTQDPSNAEIVKAFKDKNRDPSGAFQLTAFSATTAIAEAIKGAGEDDAVKAAQWLRANSVNTPIGELSWDDQGDLENFRFDVFTWKKDGSK